MPVKQKKGNEKLRMECHMNTYHCECHGWKNIPKIQVAVVRLPQFWSTLWPVIGF